jgi:nucleoside-diphosphate-sugar epimerase
MSSGEGFWSARRVLVTGAGGFIGSHLCSALVSSGASVVGTTRQVDAPGEAPGIDWRQVDLADDAAVRRLTAEVRPSVVFHLAGLVTGRQELDLVHAATRDNLLTTINLLAALVQTGCDRVVAVGSSQEPRDGVPASSPYAAAKGAATIYSRMFHAIFGLPVAVVRPHVTYGPGQETAKLIPYVATSLLAGQSPRVSRGQVLFDFVHVDDVVEGLLRSAAKEGIAGQVFDLGTGKATSVRAVVEALAELVPSTARPVVDPSNDRRGESSRSADCTETARVLGWSPSRELKEGLASTVQWYRDHPETWRTAVEK